MVVLKVGDGSLLLFPAWLQHSVDANGSTRPRISLSFNLMFTGFETMARARLDAGKRYGGMTQRARSQGTGAILPVGFAGIPRRLCKGTANGA